MATLRDLSQLKSAFKEREFSAILQYAAKGDYARAHEAFQKLPTGTQVPPEHRKTVGEIHYQAAKIKLAAGEFPRAAGLVKLCLELDSGHGLARRRHELLRSTDVARPGRLLERWVPDSRLRWVELSLYRKNLKITCGKGCDDPRGESPLHCAECKRLVTKPVTKPGTMGFSALHAVGIYRYRGDERASEPFSQLIRDFKGGKRELAPYLAILLADHLETRTGALGAVDLMTVVPPDPKRTRERGYHPPAELAHGLSTLLGVPFLEGLLEKSSSPRAKDLSSGEVRSKYRIAERTKSLPDGCHVLLVDDVTTRGETLSRCAGLLRELGASKITCAVLAQSETTHRRTEKTMHDLKKLATWYQVSKSKYLGPVRFRALLEEFGDGVGRVFRESDERLLEIKGVTKQAVAGIREQQGKHEEALQFMEGQLSLMRKCGGGIITLDDSRYPRVLRESSMCHAILYFRGSIELFTQYDKAIAIVGSRGAINPSLELATRTARELAGTGWVIVSGLAIGIDSAAHRGALDAKGKTIAVLGCGPDVVYPSKSKPLYEEIADKGLVLSEFPFGTKVEDWKLQKRNKTIVGAALGAFVVQTSAKGGAMNAARACKEQKKRLFMVEALGAPDQFTGNEAIRREFGGKVLDPDMASSQIVRTLE